MKFPKAKRLKLNLYRKMPPLGASIRDLLQPASRQVCGCWVSPWNQPWRYRVGWGPTENFEGKNARVARAGGRNFAVYEGGDFAVRQLNGWMDKCRCCVAGSASSFTRYCSHETMARNNSYLQSRSQKTSLILLVSKEAVVFHDQQCQHWVLEWKWWVLHESCHHCLHKLCHDESLDGCQIVWTFIGLHIEDVRMFTTCVFGVQSYYLQ